MVSSSGPDPSGRHKAIKSSTSTSHQEEPSTSSQKNQTGSCKPTLPSKNRSQRFDRTSSVFQQLEIDYIIGASHKELLPNWSGPTAILRIFGVTREGHSVCCHVHGLEPYFYICCPPGMGPDDISRFHQALEGRMKESNRNSNVPRFVKRVELVQRKSIMYYQPQNLQPFLYILFIFIMYILL